MSRPLLALASAFAAGCLAGGDVGTTGALALAALAAFLLALAVAAPGRAGSVAALAAAALGLGAADAGRERAVYERTPLLAIAEAADASPVALEGTARGDAQVFVDRALLVVDVDRIGIDRRGPGRGHDGLWGRARIEIGGLARLATILDGDRVRLPVVLRPVTSFRTPGAFDAREAAFHDGVHARGYCKSARLVEWIGPGTGLVHRAALVRQYGREVLRRFVLPGPEEGLVRAMVLGDRTGIDDLTADAFRAAGTYHVLALSGAQVALVAALLVGALRRAGVAPAGQALVTAASVSFYALLVGGDVPVVRAALMAGVVLLGHALELDADAANLLGLAALALLAHRPSNVGDVGFQLSFGATLAILVLTPRLVEGLPRLPLRVELAVAASLVAQAALAPLLAAHFHRTAPAAILLNLAAVPLSSAVLLCGLVVLVAAAAAPPLAPWFGDLAWVAAHALRRSSGPGMAAVDLRVPALSFLMLALWTAGLAWILKGRRGRGLLAVVAAQALGLVAPEGGGDGRLHLAVLDVGQGDALVLRSPRGRTMVVDTGGSTRGRFDMGEVVVGPYLWWAGVRTVDRLVITHAHPDHVGGVPFLLRAFRIGEVWEGPAPRHDAVQAQVDRAIAESGVARRTVVSGVGADWDGVEIRVLGPRPPVRAPWRVRNDDSVVLALRFGDVRLLLTGDIEAAGEAALPSFPAAVVKVPHHGSRSSSGRAFVAATSPRLALVSAGARNPFGHPHPETLERYRGAGALVLRTDEDGTISVSTDGRRIWVRDSLGAETRTR